MDKKSKAGERFKWIFIAICVFFVFVYVTGQTGYYETRLQKNTLLTREAILEFEKDLAEGKAVDLKDYVKADTADYRNKYSKLGYNVSKAVDTVLTDGLGVLTDFFRALFG